MSQSRLLALLPESSEAASSIPLPQRDVTDESQDISLSRSLSLTLPVSLSLLFKKLILYWHDREETCMLMKLSLSHSPKSVSLVTAPSSSPKSMSLQQFSLFCVLPECCMNNMLPPPSPSLFLMPLLHPPFNNSHSLCLSVALSWP